MKPSTIFSIFRIIFTLLWRVALTVCVLCGLVLLGCSMILNLVFNGPSETARNELTLTLLEAEWSKDIPSHFLSQETTDQICSTIDSPGGFTNLRQITLQAEGGIQASTFSTETYSAQVMLFPESSSVRLADSLDSVTGANGGDHIIVGGNVPDSNRLAGITANGVLLISDDASTLMCIDDTAVIGCGLVLIQNGQVNSTLFGGSSGYAPRAAIGQTANGTLIFITTDGWTREHWGATYQDMINLMTHYGAVNACLLNSDAHCEAWVSDATAETAQESEE